MRFQKAIKRMVALGTGAIMLGSSVFAAADLAKFPAPFIKDGKFNGVLVVGDKATAEDVIGVSDIISSMQFAAGKPAGSGGTVDIESSGDAWKVGTSTKILELAENLDGAATNREAIATITSSSFIDDTEMPGLLAKGKVSNSKGEAEYDQRFYFEDTSTGFVQYTENSDDVTADFLYFANGKQVARYEMEFTTQLESDVDDSAGSASSTGTYLTDLEDVELNILGKNFQIVTARRVNSNGKSAILTLMGGAVRDTLVEGNTKTYTIDGKDFEVTLNFVDSDEGQFIINGQTTRKLNDGDTDKLSDGTTIGVSEILYQDYAGGIHSATFFLGAQKVELRDTSISDTGSSHDMKVDDETIDNAHVIIEGTDDNSTYKVDKIQVNISADDDFYVPANGKLSEAIKAEGAEPEALFTKNWDIEYKGLNKVTTHKIQVKASGSDDYNLEFTDGRGNVAKVPVGHTPSGSVFRFGDSDNSFHIFENESITKDDYLIVTDETDSDGERQSFALRYRGGDKSTGDNPVVKFDDLGSGERIERPVSLVASTNVGPGSAGTGGLFEIAQIKLGGGTFRVYNSTSGIVDDYNIVVDLDASGAIDRSPVSINTKQGAKIDITNASSSNATWDGNIEHMQGTGSAFINITTPNADDYDDLVPTPVRYNISASSGEVRLSELDNHNMQSPEDDDDNSFGYTSMGAFIKLNAPTSDPQELTVEYPEEQRVPLVYITGKSASFTESTTTPSGPVIPVRIEVGAAKLASEVSDVNAVNAILVGGPCANAAASTVMGNPADCTEGFEPGVGKIQVWEHANGNVAMLVAGYSGLDTRNAAQVVANYANYKSQLKGTNVEVKKVNNQLTVAQAMPKPAAPVTPEVDEGEAA